MRAVLPAFVVGATLARIAAAQAPPVTGQNIRCSTDGGQTWQTGNCDATPAPAAAPGLNPTVAAAATSLGQALGQALVRSLFSRPSQATPNAPKPDAAAVAEAMRRAQFARDKNELMAALGMNESDRPTLTMDGSAPAQLQMTGPPASGDLMMADAPPPLRPLTPRPSGPTPPDVVATIHLRVGESSLLVAAPKNAAGVEIPFAVCRFGTDKGGVATVNESTGLVTAVAPGQVNIIETCNGAKAAVSVEVRPRLLRLQLLKAGDQRGFLTTTSAGRDFESGMYEEGALVTITADPSRGVTTFDGWTGPCETQTPRSCTLTMNADKAVTATFKPAPR